MFYTRFTQLRHLLLVVPLVAHPACMADETALRRDQGARPLEIQKPLIAYWDFDEPLGTTCTDRGGAAHDASSPPDQSQGLDRVEGLFGRAMRFSRRHMLRVPERPDFRDVAKISFSAWTRPTELSGYREIFRKEDGDTRVLFSYQADGSILSFGLNVGGYVECDALIDATQLADGRWHHCAATFDGTWMRVYLDGREVGSLERPGRIAAGGKAPGCIGSSNGGENFQGAIDDLAIYRDALSADEVQRLYHHGAHRIAKRTKELLRQLDLLYTKGPSFAETLARARRRYLDKNVEPDSARDSERGKELAGALLARLRAEFPVDCADFMEFTGAHPADYLVAGGNGFHVEKAGRLIDLMVEYRPLTKCQWERQTPEQLAKWETLGQIERAFAQLEASGSSAEYSPRWVELMLQAGRQIDFRPHVSEPVAPYVKPATPPTRDLSAEEARDALQRDWLHQADNNPTPARIAKELEWTRQLAERIVSAHPGQVDFSLELAGLDELQQQAASLAAPDQEFYFKVRQLKRAVALKNPVVDFDKVLFVDMPFPAGSEWPHQTRHRLGYMAVTGGRLLVLEGLSPAGKLKQLMPQEPLHGSFWRPDLSYDAKKIVFCFKPHNEKAFHLYEINIDGSGLVQRTDGPYDDLDPIYLPDDHIIFSTTRSHTYVRCMPPTNAYPLARCDLDGKNIYLISQNNEPDYVPSVMNDGRIIYTRWEYTDKPLWRAQALWTVNPDGTQVNTFWGNQSVWPDLLKDARSIPGSRRVMFTGSAHHNWFSGSVGIIDPDRGYNFPDGLTKVTADVAWPESGNGPVDPVESPDYHGSGPYAAYYSPYPLGEQDFLVSANRGGKFVLYLMDVDGNRELIYEGVHNIFHAVPLKPRQRPPVISDRVAWPDKQHRLTPKSGVIYSNNVYQGAPEELDGKAKHLRVLSIDPKTYTYWHKRPYASTGPVVSMVQSEGVKRILGTVPIEQDGSVSFHAPAGEAIHFQLLDGNYRALHTMRSFTGVMPGEHRGCLGCHELHSKTPEQLDGKSLAITKQPREITPPPWGEDTVSYVRYVQPVLDKYCGQCHQGDGEARATLDLTFRPGFLIFNEPYVTLTGRPSWGSQYQKPENPPPGFGIANMLMVEGYDQRDPRAYQTPRPMTALSYKSPLVELASSGKHYDVKVDPVSLRKLIAWVDTMCPYRGDEEVREIPDPEFQGVDWLSIRPRVKTAPTVLRPGPVD